MTSRHGSAILLAGAVSVLASCGSSGGGGSSSSGGPPGFYITIHSMSFGPAELAAPPGATVTVVNQDGFQHSVTSEAAAGDFTPGAVGGVQFDTGPFTGTATFTIPANAVDGTVIPYYCTVHKSMMATPNGSLKVDSTAKPGPAPGSGSGSGGGY
jgi:plastocyanin